MSISAFVQRQWARLSPLAQTCAPEVAQHADLGGVVNELVEHVQGEVHCVGVGVWAESLPQSLVPLVLRQVEQAVLPKTGSAQ